MDNQNKYKKVYLNVALVISQLSKDPKRKVGSVITKKNKIISTGYNGFPRDVVEDNLWDVDNKHDYVVHAEMNAMLNTNEDMEGATLYCSYQPCISCLRHALNAGISKIYFVEKQKNLKDESVWNELAKYFRIIKHQPFKKD